MRVAAGEESGHDLGACLQTVERGRQNRRALLMESAEDVPDLTRALLDAAGLFEELAIGYALIGGLAAMYCGRARFTEDVDFIAASDHERTLAEHGPAMRRRRFDPGCTWKLYHDSGVSIVIWKDAAADPMIARATRVALAGRMLPVVEVHDLIAMKLRASRPRDDYDISEILKHTAVSDDRVRSLVDRGEFAHYLDILRRTTRRL